MMSIRIRRALSSVLAALAISAQTPLRAEPSPETAKALSGVRFAENFSGQPASVKEPPAVRAERRGRKNAEAGLARSARRSGLADAGLPVPTPSAGGTEEGSPRTEMLALAGGVAGFLGTVALTVYQPLAVGALAVGGAADGASTAIQQGKTGSEVALAAARGAANGLYVFIAAGTAAGRAIGQRLDRAAP